MGSGGLLTHCIERHDDPQPGVGVIIVATLFQGPDHFACFRDRLVTIPIEMQVCRSQNIEIRDHHDQAVTAFAGDASQKQPTIRPVSTTVVVPTRYGKC